MSLVKFFVLFRDLLFTVKSKCLGIEPIKGVGYEFESFIYSTIQLSKHYFDRSATTPFGSTPPPLLTRSKSQHT
jgi:hypothetical protein